MIVQFSIDIETTDKNISELDIERALTSYWYAEHIKDKEIRGIAWKATWNSAENYEHSFVPDSYD